MRTTLVLILAGALVTFPALAGADIIRVEKDGSGDFTVIQDAIDAAAVGDPILIGPGRYEEHKPFTTDQWTEETYVAVTVVSLTIRGTDRDTVLIGPTVADSVGNGPKGIALSRELTTGLRVENLSIENVHDGLHLFHTFTLNSLSVSGCGNGVYIGLSTGSRVQRSIFSNCSFDGVFTGTGTSDIMVEDSEFIENWLCIGFNRTTNGRVRNCTFVGGGAQYGDNSTGTISACVLSGASGVIRAIVNSTVDVQDTRIECPIANILVETRGGPRNLDSLLRWILPSMRRESDGQAPEVFI